MTRTLSWSPTCCANTTRGPVAGRSSSTRSALPCNKRPGRCGSSCQASSRRSLALTPGVSSPDHCRWPWRSSCKACWVLPTPGRVWRVKQLRSHLRRSVASGAPRCGSQRCWRPWIGRKQRRPTQCVAQRLQSLVWLFRDRLIGGGPGHHGLGRRIAFDQAELLQALQQQQQLRRHHGRPVDVRAGSCHQLIFGQLASRARGIGRRQGLGLHPHPLRLHGSHRQRHRSWCVRVQHHGLYTHWRADIGGLKPARETRVDTAWRYDRKHVNQYTQRYGSSGADRTGAPRSQRGLKAQAIGQCCSALP